MNYKLMKSVPKTRLEFERNTNRLRKYSLKKDGINIHVDSYRIIRDIKKARYLPNGRVNLKTIEVGARLMANMAYQLEEYED